MKAKTSTLVQAGKEAETLLKDLLERYGFLVIRTGQERFLSRPAIFLLRNAAADLMTRAIRHMPDMLAVHKHHCFPAAYWDAKHKQTYNSPHFILGRDFYFEQLARMDKGERVVIAFLDVDGTWYAQWVNELQPVGERPRPRGGVGYVSPMISFRVDSFLPLEELLKQHWRPEL